jgi:hypothetical protein
MPFRRRLQQLQQPPIAGVLPGRVGDGRMGFLAFEEDDLVAEKGSSSVRSVNSATKPGMFVSRIPASNSSSRCPTPGFKR